ncbi:HNH endonuclease [Nocardia wallacei]|uniref:HNH endonuclease n=1 Tax=Nocardia wallacei TaxID=480035 RepID=UPI00313DF38E
MRLMTSQLRTMIKGRDNYTCRNCSVSVAAEPQLLLKANHIVPVSRGGLTTPDNLQALCWRCNRTKSNRSSPSDQKPPSWSQAQHPLRHARGSVGRWPMPLPRTHSRVWKL